MQRMQNLVGSKERHMVHLESISMNRIYTEKLNEAGEKTRIESLEMFDEFEEWDLLQSHYCITLAVCSNDFNQTATQIRI